MKGLKQFDIHLFKLPVGTHDYQFNIKDEFFEWFENEIVEQGNLQINVSLSKSETMIEMDFDIKGTVLLECDRSLDPFDFPIHTQKTMRYRLGDEHQELSDEFMVIPRNSQTLNLASLLFEFISLEVPMKKLHPRFREEDENNEEFIYTSNGEAEGNNASSFTNQEETVDPRWAALKNLKK